MQSKRRLRNQLWEFNYGNQHWADLLISFLELISLNVGRRGVYGIQREFNFISWPELELISIPYGNQLKFSVYGWG